jgi:carboxyl-terminal processing protease
MIAGPANTSGKIFEKEIFNDRDPFGFTEAQVTVDFHSTAQGFSTEAGTPLPALGLNRVFVLTSSNTCSASEAVVNGLRGAAVTVNLIGGVTCGKPYGFFPQDNCGTTFFPSSSRA